MILKYTIPKKVEEQVALSGDERIYYAVPYDIGTDAAFLTESYLVVTTTRILVICKGTIEKTYQIKDCTDGFYCLFYVTCEPDCVKECDRVMKITDDVLKHMIVKSEGFTEEAPKAADETPVEE